MIYNDRYMWRYETNPMTQCIKIVQRRHYVNVLNIVSYFDILDKIFDMIISSFIIKAIHVIPDLGLE